MFFKDCPFCGKNFSVSSFSKLSQKYCSRYCSNEGQKKQTIKNCSFCQKEFSTNLKYINKKDYYCCSIKCKSGLAHSLREKQNICLLCGSKFTLHKGRKKYCSVECLVVGKSNNTKTGQFRNCKMCGEEIYVTLGRLKTGKVDFFCSRKHANEWQGRNKLDLNCKLCGVSFKASPSRIVNSKLYFCSRKCHQEDPDMKKRLLENTAKQQKMSINKPEKIGYALLDKIGLSYESQFIIADKFCVDAFLIDYAVVVQFDGNYWHGDPVKFPNPNHIQKKRIRLDVSQDAYMKKLGFKVIRIWESDLLGDLNGVEKRILENL